MDQATALLIGYVAFSFVMGALCGAWLFKGITPKWRSGNE